VAVFAADVDFVELGIVIDVDIAAGVVDGPNEVLSCRLVLI
jgi:hypothetical protein